MNRRSFFSTLTKLAAVPFALALAKVYKPKPEPPIHRSGYMKVGSITMSGSPGVDFRWRAGNSPWLGNYDVWTEGS